MSEPTYTGLPKDEIERRYRLVREALDARRARRGRSCAATSTRASRAPSPTSRGFVIVHRYAYVLLPRRGRAGDRLPERGPLRRRARHDVDRRAGVRRPARRVARRPGARQARRRLRARLRDDRARLRARSPARAELVAWDVAVRPRARGQVRARARLGARERPHQHRGLLGLPRGVRAREDRARDPRAVRASTSSSQGCGRWTMDMVLDGPNGSALPEFKIAGARRDRRRPTACSRRSRSPARAGTGSRSRARSAPASRATTRSGCSRPTTSTSRRRAARSVPARPPTTSTAPSPKGFLDRGYHLGHVTGHSIGMTMIEFPKIGEGDETELEAGWCFSMHPHAISRGRAWRASTCRTRGSSPRTAACRSPACRCGSSTAPRRRPGS